MGKSLIWDTRQQKGKHEHILKWFEENEYKIVRSKLPFGDVCYLTNMSKIIDTKKDIQEIVGNVCQQHKRFCEEIKKAKDNEIKLEFLIQDENVKCLDDIQNWKNPRRFISEKAIDGGTLYKILKSIEEHYDTKFNFTTREECGAKIIELLGGEKDE